MRIQVLKVFSQPVFIQLTIQFIQLTNFFFFSFLSKPSTLKLWAFKDEQGISSVLRELLVSREHTHTLTHTINI